MAGVSELLRKGTTSVNQQKDIVPILLVFRAMKRQRLAPLSVLNTFLLQYVASVETNQRSPVHHHVKIYRTGACARPGLDRVIAVLTESVQTRQRAS